MSIEQTDSVDIIHTNPDTDTVVLTMVDSLDWQNFDQHAKLLKSKVAMYLRIATTGQLAMMYPTLQGKKVGIDLVCAGEPPAKALGLIREIADEVRRNAIVFSASVYEGRSLLEAGTP